MTGIAIIGAGMVADVHVRALGENADLATIIGVAARNREKLEAFCAPRGLTAFSDADALLHDEQVEAVIVLTPPDARSHIIEICASLNKPVLIEKPIERTSTAAQALVERAEEAGIALGIVFQHRFRAASQALAARIAENAFGALTNAQIIVPWWRPQSYYDEPGRGTYARDGGGVLISQAIHTLDLAQTFTGPVAEVQALAATTRQHKMEAEDFVSAGLVFANGAVGALIATTASFPGTAESIVLDFEQAAVRLQSGVLDIFWHDGRTEQVGESATTGGGADPMAFPHHWHAALQRDFLLAIREGRSPSVTARDALQTHRLIDAIMASSREGKRITV